MSCMNPAHKFARHLLRDGDRIVRSCCVCEWKALGYPDSLIDVMCKAFDHVRRVIVDSAEALKSSAV